MCMYLRGRVPLLSGVIDSALACGRLIRHAFEDSGQHYRRLCMRAPEALP